MLDILNYTVEYLCFTTNISTRLETHTHTCTCAQRPYQLRNSWPLPSRSRCLHPDCRRSRDDGCRFPRLLWCHPGVAMPSGNCESITTIFVCCIVFRYIEKDNSYYLIKLCIQLLNIKLLKHQLLSESMLAVIQFFLIFYCQKTYVATKHNNSNTYEPTSKGKSHLSCWKIKIRAFVPLMIFVCGLLQFFACLVILFACEVAAGIWGYMHKDTVRLSPHSLSHSLTINQLHVCQCSSQQANILQ